MQRSDSIADLAAALVKARPTFKTVTKGHTATVASTKGTYKYTYSTLDDLYDATVAALSACGLVTLQNIETTRDGVSVSTLLMHASGQFLHFDAVSLPSGSTPQSVGSAITYARRYSLQAALGLAAEEDDDGQQAAQKPAPKPTATRQAGPPTEPTPPAPTRLTPSAEAVISDAQRKRLWAIAKGKDWTDEDIKKLLATKGYTSSKEIRVRDYDALVKAVETGEIADDADDEGRDHGDFQFEGGVQ
jgi:hypothetical protein